ncbi:hypothetical protein QYF36_024114 [Acer negundo]|nr:hypothetical protein QYF36_024114 [Acer negundo]
MNKHFLGFIDNLKGTEIPYPPRICAWQIDGGKERIEGRNVSKTEENPDVVSSVEENTGRVLDKRKGLMRKKEVVVAHPWPKWIERLVKQNYFDHKRKDEDKMVRGFINNLKRIEIPYSPRIRAWRIDGGEERIEEGIGEEEGGSGGASMARVDREVGEAKLL